MKFINYKNVLLLLTFFSIYVILSVDFEIMPKIPSPLSKEFADKINSSSLSLAYSFVAAYIFYVVTSIIPRKMLIYRSKIILSEQIHQLQYEMFVCLNQILFIFDIKKDIMKIREADLLPVNDDLGKKYKGFYSTHEYSDKWYKKGKAITGFSGLCFEYPQCIYDFFDNIPTKINKIRNSNPNFHVDETFAEILASLETSRIIELNRSKNKTLFSTSDSYKYLYKLFFDYKRLVYSGYAKVFRSSYHTIHFYTQEENEQVAERRKQILNSIQKYKDIYPCIIHSSQSNIAKSITAYLNQGFIGTINPENNNLTYLKKKYNIISNLEDIQIQANCKCIILIDIHISKSIINRIKKNHNDKLIIIIKPTVLFNTRASSFKNMQISQGVYNIYFHCSFILKNLMFIPNNINESVIKNINSIVTNIVSNYSKNLM